MGRVYQRTAIGPRATPAGRNTYSQVRVAELSERKTALTAAELLNDRVPTDRGTEFCGANDRHEYEPYLAVEDIDHTRTRTKTPRTNGICERFHKTLLDEFYRVAFRKKVYRAV